MKWDNNTLDLLDWEPPNAVTAFDASQVRGASIKTIWSKAVAQAMKDSGLSREELAAAIGDYLGEDCSKAMLDAYASEAREDHVINIVRFEALLEVTGDRRLLQLLAEKRGWAVIDARYLPAIEDAMLADKIEEMNKRHAAARRRWKGARS